MRTKVIIITAIVVLIVAVAVDITSLTSPQTFCELTGIDRTMVSSIAYDSTTTPISLNDINAVFSGTFRRVFTAMPDDAEQLTVYGQNSEVLLTIARSDNLYVIDSKIYRLTYNSANTNADVAEQEDAAVLKTADKVV